MTRFEALASIMACLDRELVVCNLGHPSQELFSLCDRPENFYMLGSMGLASSIGLGLALASPGRTVVVLDGDGSVLMNMGTLASVAVYRPQRYILIVLDNGVYGSTGAQPTYTAKGFDLAAVSRSCGIPRISVVDDPKELEAALRSGLSGGAWPLCIVAKVTTEAGGNPSVVPLDAVTIQRRFRKAIHGLPDDPDQKPL